MATRIFKLQPDEFDLEGKDITKFLKKNVEEYMMLKRKTNDFKEKQSKNDWKGKQKKHAWRKRWKKND